MKTIQNKYIIFILLSFLVVLSVNAQDKKSDKPASTINLVAHYLDKENAVEMRFFPDKKPVFYTGLNSGFIIERVDITVVPKDIYSVDDLTFTKIGEAKAYSEAQWAESFSKANAETKHD